jgi:[protein-PII] uridylyltransferase
VSATLDPALPPAPPPDARSAEASAALRAALDTARAAMRTALARPTAGAGVEAAGALALVYDRAVAARWRHATDGIDAPLALVATGGWARLEMAPYSDIDLVVIHRATPDDAKRAIDRLLYPLWDAKVAVGHAVREPRAAARLARGDLATATALLDVRHLAGDRGLTDALIAATRNALAPGGNPNDFITALADEKARRHDRFGDSLYLLEPNLKQGIGGLRDLTTALWAAHARWVPPRPGHPTPLPAQVIEALVTMGHLTRRQAAVLTDARDLLLRLRGLVQLAAGRRTDQLTFEIQEAIAPPLYRRDDERAPAAGGEPGGFDRPGESESTDEPVARTAASLPPPRPAVAPAVEALMRDFYVHARGVVQVADRLLESARVPARRRPRIAPLDGTFIAFNGELAVKDPRVFAQRPSEMLRLFRVAVAEQLPVYGHTRELIAETLADHTGTAATALRDDPVAHRLFVEALIDPRDRRQPSALEIMHQLGVLNALMPEWAPCTCRVQHDLYHVYTVDQHQLYAVAMLKRIARGELAERHPTATQLIAEVTRPAALYLATLLHDVGKPLGKGHAEKGAVIAGIIGRRLGMAAADVELAETLVRQHLTMSHLSQRRDLADPEVIARFAERIGRDEDLIQLYLLTLCDTAMTAPNNLSAWKDELLRELMLRARAHLRGRRGDAGAAEVDPAAAAIGKVHSLLTTVSGTGTLPAFDVADATAVLAGIDRRLFTQLTPRQTARLVKVAYDAAAAPVDGDAPPVGIATSYFPMKGHSEVCIVAPDQPGVLAAIAGVLTANRVDVLGAVVGRATVGGRPLAADVFFVRDLVGAAIAEDDPRWDRVGDDLRTLLAEGRPDPGAVRSLIARRRPPSGLPPRFTPAVATEIRVLPDDAAGATIVEVFTRDRVGVLHAITQTLTDLGLDIALSKVSTEGEKVADVFYVTRRTGPDGAPAKVRDAAEVAAIAAALRAALGPA